MNNAALEILLISTYELGRQPFGLASPAAWLRQAGFRVVAVDCAVSPFPEAASCEAGLIGVYIPMHTATRMAAEMLPRIRLLNPHAHICCFGLYAPMNEAFLRSRGADSFIGGEFESPLTALAMEVLRNAPPAGRVSVSTDRQQFLVPDRNGLPPLSRYAQLCSGTDRPRVTGYTETTRGCRHLCRHCPIVPVYKGRFRVVQREVVLADIRQQVEAGAEHLTFGDPDFFNGPGHVLPIVASLHNEFPELTYDVTIKIEHLRRYAHHLPVLRDTGCAFVTSAVEAVDDQILKIFDKGHSRDDFIRTAGLFADIGMVLNPTFVTFNPWISLTGYRDLLALLVELNLVGHVSPIQLGIRLLIPSGSLLLELPEMQDIVSGFEERRLTYDWRHPDPRMDALQQTVMHIIESSASQHLSRPEVFGLVWEACNALMPDSLPLPILAQLPARAAVPYLNEPWYC